MSPTTRRAPFPFARHGRFLALLLATLAFSAVAEEPLLTRSPGRRLRIESVSHPAGAEWTAEGFSSGDPDGVVVVGTVQFAGAPGPVARAAVEQGVFRLRFEAPRGRVFAGRYALQVRTPAEEQPAEVTRGTPGGFAEDAASVEFAIGTEAEAERDRAVVRERIGTILGGLRRLYRQITERESFVRSRLAAERAKGPSPLEESVAEKLLAEWDKYGRDYWENALRGFQMDFADYRDARFLSPLPEAEEELGRVLVLLGRFYGACWWELCAQLGLPVPGRVAAEAKGRAALEGGLRAGAARVYERAGIPPSRWEALAFAREEAGAISGDTYASRAVGFRITKPAGWRFDTEGATPSTRLRLLPPASVDGSAAGAKRRFTALVVVEEKDVPDARDAHDLARLSELAHFERWPGYKKLASRELSVPDPGMPGGTRSGFELLLRAEDKQRPFKVLVYELFERTHQRTWGVVCIAAPELYAQFEPDFAAIRASFALLDAPEPGEGGK